MPLRILAATLLLLAVLNLASCTPPRSDAEQTYRDWLRAVDDIRRRTASQETVTTIRESSSADMVRALQENLRDYIDEGYRQTGYRHVVAFRFFESPPAGQPGQDDARITAEVCVDASLTGQIDASGEPVGLTTPLRYARLVAFTADASGTLRVDEDTKSRSDVCG